MFQEAAHDASMAYDQHRIGWLNEGFSESYCNPGNEIFLRFPPRNIPIRIVHVGYDLRILALGIGFRHTRENAVVVPFLPFSPDLRRETEFLGKNASHLDRTLEGAGY